MRCILKRTTILGAAVLLLSASALACPGKQRGNLDKMQVKLELSDEQVAAIREIYESVDCNCHELESREERQQCQQEHQAEVRLTIQGVLDDQQLEKFLARHSGEKRKENQDRQACRRFRANKRNQSKNKDW